jgi:N-acetyl-gamma-glutamyl-phosphate reductase
MMRSLVFIDGEAGTTGLQIRDRLADRSDIELITLEPTERKDPVRRSEALNAAEVSILCLPDAAAREAVAMITNPRSRVIDASTAHRTDPDWTYGLPELQPGHDAKIAAASRVSNPGCYPTGFIALVRPLVAAGLVPRNWPLSVNAVSGYSGGGKAMIAEFEDKSSNAYVETPFRIYGLSLQHKHAPEMKLHAGLERMPLFAPAVGRFAQGMLVEVPLHLDALPGAPSHLAVQAALETAYAGSPFISVEPTEESAVRQTLDPEQANGTNRMHLFVFGAAESRQARLVAVLDNLGKGASGAAVQNLNLMLGAPIDAGLTRREHAS